MLTLGARREVNREEWVGENGQEIFLSMGTQEKRKVARILWGAGLKLCSQNYLASLMRSSFILMYFLPVRQNGLGST